MTLDRARVQLTRGASTPGVAFVALSRVRHPDHLVLDDDFPDLATIMKQAERESFRQRVRWERQQHVKFSRTIRRHMRDPAWFAPERLWTAEMNDAAERLLACVRAAPTLADDDVVTATLRQRRGARPAAGPRVVEERGAGGSEREAEDEGAGGAGGR